MNELTIIKQDDMLYVDSREVAKMVGKRHADLLRDIERYIGILENAKLRSQDFFVKTEYKTDNNNKTYPWRKNLLISFVREQHLNKGKQ